jgi:hypothetical protein
MTLKELKKYLRMFAVFNYKYPPKPKQGKKWIERMMNKFGWYRQTEVLVLREEYLNFHFIKSHFPLEIDRHLWVFKYGILNDTNKFDIFNSYS